MAKELIRAFVAVPLAEELRPGVVAIQDRLRRCPARVKWVEAQNLHFTLKFLGDIGPEGVQRVLAASRRAAENVSAFDLELAGVGAFPNPRRPRVVWVGSLAGAEALTELAERVEGHLAALGFARENRPFQAHLTIGRFRDPEQAGGLAEALAAEPEAGLGTMPVRAFELMRSDLRPSGPIYTSLGTIPLSGEGVANG
jgi:2'-5' RNA ligase